MKASYHPAIILAWYLKCLPQDISEKIPRSTKSDWSHKSPESLFGFEWYHNNRKLFETLEAVSRYKSLLKINKALIRIIAVAKFINTYRVGISKQLFNLPTVVMSNFNKITHTIRLRKVLKMLNLSFTFYQKLKLTSGCNRSLLLQCPVKHPSQLLSREVSVIKGYLETEHYIHWPLSSVYYQIQRDNKAFMALSTFYKYVSLLNLHRKKCIPPPKNHITGIRACAPLQLLHADVTVFRTADNQKTFIYLVQDNYSRAILSWQVSGQCKAEITLENLKRVYENHLKPSGNYDCSILTDGGSENFGSVKEFINASISPSLVHLVAQANIEFSNSMIEAANKQLKYNFLYHKHIADILDLKKYVEQAVMDYNNRPHHVLNGLTPTEVLHGIDLKQVFASKETATTKANRLLENRKIKCCLYSF